MAMSPPLDNNSNQRQEGDEDKTETELKRTTSGVNCVSGVSGHGKAYNTNTAGVQNINNLNQYAEGRPKGFSVTVDDEGGKNFLKISAPLRDGHTCTTVKVICDVGHVENFCYEWNELDGQYPKYKTKLIIEHAPPIGDIVQTHYELFNAAREKFEELYGAKMYRFHKKCLLLEFEHSSEEEAQAMVDDIDNVTRIFKDFAQKCGFPADKVTVKAEYELVEQPDAELESQSSQSEDDVECRGHIHTGEGSTAQHDDVPKTALVKAKEIMTKQLEYNPISGQTQTEEGSTARHDDVLKTDVSVRVPEQMTKLTIDEEFQRQFPNPRVYKDLRETSRRKLFDLQQTPITTGIDLQQTPIITGIVSRIRYTSTHPHDDDDDDDELDEVLLESLCDDDDDELDEESGLLTISLDLQSDPEKMSFEATRKLCGLRNSGGGGMKIHSKQKEIYTDFNYRILPQCMNACLVDDEFSDDVYTIKEENGVTTIDAE